jgi:Sporulation and spore germination
MPRNLKIALGVLCILVLIGLISLRGLHQRIEHLAETEAAEERARREVLAPPISTPTDVKGKAEIFWAVGPDRIAPVEVELELSADPVQRAKQVLHALVEDPPTAEQRTVPPDTTLLAFYILPDGTAIADFSDALASETPSGILSEEIAVGSIARTLAINMPSLRRLKILIHGQEVDTLAGHVDLTGYFDLNPAAPAPPPQSVAAPAAKPAK